AATLDLIVIIKMDCLDVSRNLWTDLDHVRFNGRIVSGLVAGAVDKPAGTTGENKCAHDEKSEETANWPLRIRINRARTADLAGCDGPILVSGFQVDGCGRSGQSTHGLSKLDWRVRLGAARLPGQFCNCCQREPGNVVGYLGDVGSIDFE